MLRLVRIDRVLAPVVAVATLAAAACGGDDGVSDFTFPPDAPATTEESLATTSTTLETTTSAAVSAPPSLPATEGDWVAAVGNLEGLPSECGNMSLVSAHPERDQLIAGVAQNGLWSSTDGGASWTQLGQGAGSASITNRTGSILYDPEHPDTFWESGIYNGSGVYRTDDNGQTFVALGDAAHNDHISVDLADPARATLLTNVHESGTVLRSTDGGETWADASGDLPADIGWTRATYVVDAQVHLVGAHDGTSTGIYRTTDGGASWTRVVEVGVAGPPLTLRETGEVLWPLVDGSLIRSADGGATWTEAAPAGSVSGSVVELPNGDLATYTDRIAISTDGGARWRSIGPALPYVPVGMTYLPARATFYIWRFDCSDTANPVAADAIMRLGLTTGDG